MNVFCFLPAVNLVKFCEAMISRRAIAPGHDTGPDAIALRLIKSTSTGPDAIALRLISLSPQTPSCATRLGQKLMILYAVVLFGSADCFAQLKSNAPQWPTVGTTTELADVILPGPKLVGKPIDDRDPVVVRVTDAIAHGDGFRYRIEYQGMEPGNFDLAQSLVRKDGQPTTDLPSIPVQIRSLLPPGQIQPNELIGGWLPRMGGYQILMLVLAVLWTLGLLGLIFLGHKRKAQQQDQTPPTTLAAMLKLRIQKACDNEADSKDLAELERMLVAFWQKKLNLDADAPHQAIVKIRQHADSGPLMQKIESWVHQPQTNRAGDQDVDWESLLEPYRNLPADSLEANSLETGSVEAHNALR